MIESVVPIGATVRAGDIELGVTWLLVGDDWMVLDSASQGDSFLLAAITDDRGRSYPAGGGGAFGGLDGVLRCSQRFRSPLDRRATAIQLRFIEPRDQGPTVAELTVPMSRIPATTLRARVLPGAPFMPEPGTCFECGRPSQEWQCGECRGEGMTLGGLGGGELVPEVVGPVSGDLDLAPGLRHAFAGILAWADTFTVRFVVEPVPGPRGGPNDPPGPITGRWTGEDAKGRAYVGRTRQSGFGTGGGKALGDATVEFMPALDRNAGPLLVRTGPPGRPTLELELPIQARG